MPRYVALLRGINVGRAKQIPMAELRELLTDAGFTAVRTHLRSGNVVFTDDRTDTDLIAGLISTRLAERLNVETGCLVRTAAELADVIAANPFPTAEGAKLLAHFYAPPTGRDTAEKHPPTDLDPEHIRVTERVIYQWCPAGISNSPDVSAFVTRKWRTVITGRNWNTVTALHNLL